jgi:uncharacterized protein (DUF1810 family)
MNFDLERFVRAQDGVYERALQELRAGRKRSHWMWFIFPQMKGLGVTATSSLYGIQSLDEAQAYLEHPVLGARLRECTETVLGIEGSSAEEIFGFPDWLKFRSCMTLFDRASPEDVFAGALVKFFDSAPDPKTLRLLS